MTHSVETAAETAIKQDQNLREILQQCFVIGMIAALAWLMSTQQAHAFEYTFTQAELQAQLNKQKLEAEHPLIQVKITHPKIALNDKTQKATLSGDVTMNLLGSYNGDGNLAIEGTPVYKPAHKAFYFENPAITQLNIKDQKPDQVDAIRLTLNQALKQWLKDIPIYQLKDRTLQEKMASSRLESVSIRDDELVLDFSVFGNSN